MLCDISQSKREGVPTKKGLKRQPKTLGQESFRRSGTVPSCSSERLTQINKPIKKRFNAQVSC